MKKYHLKKILYMISIIGIILFVTYTNFNMVIAASNESTISYSVRNSKTSPGISQTIWGDALGLAKAGSFIVGIIRWVGLAILIGSIIVRGIRFVSVSPEGKAEIKNEIIMLVIGAVILFALTTILGMIINMVQNAGLQ